MEFESYHLIIIAVVVGFVVISIVQAMFGMYAVIK